MSVSQLTQESPSKAIVILNDELSPEVKYLKWFRIELIHKLDTSFEGSAK